jgi:hypothetical protein
MWTRDQVMTRARACGSRATTLQGAGRAIIAARECVIPAEGSGLYRRRDPRTTTRTTWYARQHAKRIVGRYAHLCDWAIGSKILRFGSAVPQRVSAELRQAVAMIPWGDPALDYLRWLSYPMPVRGLTHIPDVAPPHVRAAAIRAAEGWSTDPLNEKLMSIVGDYAENAYDWGRLRVHSRGDQVGLPDKVGMVETGDNRDWHRRSTLQRQADYYLAMGPAGPYRQGWMYVATDATRREWRRVWISPNYLRVGAAAERITA